jgi:hypothetical protein
MAMYLMTFSLRPKVYVIRVAELVTHPGKRLGRIAPSTTIR